MKKITEKSQSVLLLLCIVLLASCGGETPAADTTAADSTVTTAPEETTISDDLGEYDFGGRVFNIVYSADQLGSTWPYTIEEETGDILSDAVYRREINTEDRFNVDITWFSAGGDTDKQINAFRQSILAGDGTYQLCINHMFNGFNAAISDGLLYDFNKMPIINLDKPWWNQSARKNLEVEGVLLTMTSDIIYSYYDTIYFNKQIMDEHQLAYPYEKVLDGTWTWDYLAETTKNVSKDINGDGKYDDNDLTAFAIDKNISTMTRLIHSNGMTMASIGTDGRPTLDNLSSEKMHTVIEKYYDFVWGDNRCYYAGTDGPTESTDMFASGNAMMMHIQTSKLPLLRDVEFEFGIVPLPKYDEKQKNYHTLASTQMLLLPADMQDPEFVGVVLEALSAESWREVTPKLYNVVYTNKYLRDEHSQEMFEIIRGSLVYDFNWNYGNGNSMSYLVGNTVGKQNKNISSYIAASVGAAQEILNDVYDAIVENYKN